MFFSCGAESKLIKNINLPSCRNCIHYSASFYNNDFSSSLNKCTYFGTKNVQSDKVNYDYAENCRNDEEKCGLEGKYFEQNPYFIWTIIKHGLVSNLPQILLISYLCIVSLPLNIHSIHK